MLSENISIEMSLFVVFIEVNQIRRANRRSSKVLCAKTNENKNAKSTSNMAYTQLVNKWIVLQLERKKCFNNTPTRIYYMYCV